ncbi:RNA 3'-terminal phosphate cyclase [Natrialba asiatica]|uniref:RNA 3'-terminal phosphate cyclase n=1 Tax=Natrialba asiatica (strain ATCC 700177 / DSM 12278 / JCM 9576 / FERM P-10747 / NBRC 102637 / 172P1) TaxID=29540 RepID=M0AZ06_NATA1|nr:RNA 3'-terminal phosphate cyclase [Natrialba asiatica]ELZ03906.1 RNA 3'-terminal-phosphate cyclase [Natrialba asiatica DSM 12278]
MADVVRELDGANAGGQFLRTALTLAVLEHEPVRITNVRGDRSTPGLRHQHLAVLETLAELASADVSGAELGAETVEFSPGRARLAGGDYAVDIGTAGSVALLFDAVLPLATELESPLSLTATGGTDVAWSPPLDYFRRVKLPLLRQFGLAAACEWSRRGFYPDGGGRATLRLAPSTLEPIELTDRTRPTAIRVHSTEAAALSDRNVAHRQAEGALERLDARDCELVERSETTAASDSPGSAVVLVLRIDDGERDSEESGGALAGFGALGERGVPAERVGENAADAANRFLDGTAPVDRHMADQLLVFLSIAGGRVRVPAATDHVETSCALLESFGVPVEKRPENDAVVIAVDPVAPEADADT